jgi:hypothetical protein
MILCLKHLVLDVVHLSTLEFLLTHQTELFNMSYVLDVHLSGWNNYDST